MNNHQQNDAHILINEMRNVLGENPQYCEVQLVGKVIREEEKLKLEFPVGVDVGGVYGFSVKLVNQEIKDVFCEAKKKGLSKLKNINDFKCICGNQYPLYWGKDVSIGHRVRSHLAGCDTHKGTGLIRLDMYKSLRDKEIYCGIIIVNDANAVECLLEQRFPSLLKTKTIKTEAAETGV